MNTTIQTSRGTFTIDSARDAKMFSRLSEKKYPQEDLLTLASMFVTLGGVAVDVGGHIGTFAVPLAKSGVNVIAFEPSEESFKLLSVNAVQNGVTLDIRACGLGAEEGRARLVEKSQNNAGAHTLAEGEGNILVKTLDKEVERADFIKIDAEGMEGAVLRGASALIERARPTILFEVNLSALRAHDTSPRDLETFFKQHQYRLYFPYDKGGETILGRVSNLETLTACIAPRSWLTHAPSAPFDVLAVPHERPLPFPATSSARVLARLVGANLYLKLRRFIKAALSAPPAIS